MSNGKNCTDIMQPKSSSAETDMKHSYQIQTTTKLLAVL